MDRNRTLSRFCKLLQSGDSGRPKTSRRSKSGVTSHSGLKYSFACLLISATLLIILLSFYADTLPPIIDGIAIRLGYEEKQFAVVIDAGSTGSRVLAYEFHLGYMDGRLVLDRELFKEVKPGLSSFADKPADGAGKIVSLMADAKNFIPRELWHTTPIVLKATAGLRLLDSAKADNLLNAVREVIQASGFLVPENAVEIMDGTDEGIFAWFTVNFLLNRLSGRNTVAALDLGGGSTQVTFVPQDPIKTPSLGDFMHNVPTGNGHVDVFTHSYLNLGLMAMRYAVFSNGFESNETVLSSECVNPIVHRNLWRYANVEYAVSGKENDKSTKEKPVVDLERCQKIIRQKITPLIKPRPVTLKQNQIAAFSYYYERAIETGLVDPFEGGEIEISELKLKVEQICAIPNTDQPFMCLDISYIAMLLEEGFGLMPTTKVKLYKKIDNHEISWALGCAYNLLTKHIKKP